MRQRHTRRSLASLAAITCVALTLGACDDTTAPRTPPRPAAGKSVAASPGSTIVVHAGDMHGWSFTPDGAGGACADSARCRFVAGPATPPLGTGSAELAATRTSPASLLLRGYAGTRLDEVTALSFASFQPVTERGTASNGDRDDERRENVGDDEHDDGAMTLELIIDYDLATPTTGDMGRLVYSAGNDDRHDEARLRGPAWQRHDARAGRWWGTRGQVRVNGRLVENPCVESSPCTWAKLLKRFPNVGIHATNGGIALSVRRGSLARMNADDVEIGTGGVLTTYDFEATVPTPQPLLVLTDLGVSGTPAESDSTFAFGTAITWDFRAPADGRLLTTYLDGKAVPNAGSVRMTAPHTLSAQLRTDLSLRPEDQPVFDAIRLVLTSPDPAPPFQALMDLAGRGYATDGEEVTQARFARAIASAIDPRRDSAALRRVDDALGGHLFEINIPDDISAAPSRLAPSAPVRHRSADVVAAPQVVGNGTADPTAIVYVNGVGNLFADAAKTQAHLGYLLRRNVYRFRDPQDIVMRLVYNRNDVTQTPPRGPLGCLLESGTPGELTALPRYLACRAASPLSPITSMLGDLREALGLLGNKALPASGPVVQDIQMLADSLRTYMTSGRNVVVVPHSEGNLITERALAELNTKGVLTRNGSPYCVAVTPLASPTTHYAPADARYVHPVQLAGDAIIVASHLPTGAEAFPATPNALDTRLAAQRAAHSSTTGVRYLRELLDGGQIHTMDTYLSVDGGRDLVMTAAEEAYNACATGYLGISGPMDAQYPGQYTMLLGSTAQYAVSAVNGAGEPLVGKPVSWTSDGAMTSITSDGLATAISIGGTGWVRAQVGWQSSRLLIVPWSKPPLINSVSCSKGETRYDGRSMITSWTSTVDAQPSTPYAPIKGYAMLLEMKLRWSGADRLSAAYFASQSGNTATTVTNIAQTIAMDGTPEGGQWVPTGRCIGRVTDTWGKMTEMYSP